MCDLIKIVFSTITPLGGPVFSREEIHATVAWMGIIQAHEELTKLRFSLKRESWKACSLRVHVEDASQAPKTLPKQLLGTMVSVPPEEGGDRLGHMSRYNTAK